MRLRVIPTTVHGAIDYVKGPALTVTPDLLRLNGGRGSAVAPRVAGAGSTVYNALTDHPLGLRRIVPMRTHLALDALGGLALAAAPWVSGSARHGLRYWLPHALVGAGEVAMAFTTRTARPQSAPQRAWSAARGSVSELTPRKAAALGVGLAAAGVLLYSGRRWLWRAAAVAAEAVEEVADEIEDAADWVEDKADDLADFAEERAEKKEPAKD